MQGSDVNLLYDNPLLKRFRTYVIGRIDKIIAVSSLLADRVQALGAAPEKVALIPNGVDTSTFKYVTNEKRFDRNLLWVGRMSIEKGVEYLIRAISQVVAQFPQTTLTLVGDGPLRADIENLINSLGLEDHVILTGMLTHEEIPAHLARADLFVLPSLSEGLPLVLVEAMSAGKPVVATRVGGIPDVLVDEGEHQTGYLVPPKDPEALTESICTLLGAPEKAHRMGQNGRERIEQQFTWSTIADQTIAIYKSLL